MGYFKGKSILNMFEQYAKLKYKYGNRLFLGRRYYVSMVGANKQTMQEYIKNQAKQDMITAQICMVEYYDPLKEWLESYNKKPAK